MTSEIDPAAAQTGQQGNSDAVPAASAAPEPPAQPPAAVAPESVSPQPTAPSPEAMPVPELPTPTAPVVPAAAKKKRRSSPFSDPVVRWLLIGAIALVVIWLAGVVSAIVFGLTDTPAPRTYVEKQIDMLSGEVQRTPKNELAWADYAAALITAKQYGKAEDVIKQGLKAAGTKAYLTAQRARLERARGNLDAALKYADEAAKTGLAERKAIIKGARERSGTRALPTVPGLTAGLIIKSEILAEKENWKGVVETCTELLKYDATDAEAFVARADAYAKLKKKKQAEADYRAALKFIPDMQQALDGLKALGVADK